MGHAYHFPLPRKNPRPVTITPRQRECLDLLVGGWTPKEIAYQLGIAKSRVEHLLRVASQRTGSRTREQLAAKWALEIQKRETVEGVAA